MEPKGNDMADELLPCPFCHGTPTIASSTIPRQHATRIRCENCGTEKYGYDSFDESRAHERAVKAWNTRARLSRPSAAEAVADPASMLQRAEEHLCECGAAGSGEGHTDWCPWLKSSWRAWGDAVNASAYIPAAAELLKTPAIHKLRVEGAMMTREQVAEALLAAAPTHPSPQGGAEPQRLAKNAYSKALEDRALKLASWTFGSSDDKDVAEVIAAFKAERAIFMSEITHPIGETAARIERECPDCKGSRPMEGPCPRCKLIGETGDRAIPPVDTKLSQETVDALKAIDANIRNAHRMAGSILVGSGGETGGPEPVAYAVYKKGKHGVWDLGLSVDQQYLSSGEFTVAPLYTHPVPDGPADAVSEAEVEAALATWPKPWEEYNLGKAMRACLEAAQRGTQMSGETGGADELVERLKALSSVMEDECRHMHSATAHEAMVALTSLRAERAELRARCFDAENFANMTITDRERDWKSRSESAESSLAAEKLMVAELERQLKEARNYVGDGVEDWS